MLSYLQDLLEHPVVTQEYADMLGEALSAIKENTSIRALAYKVIGVDILERVTDALFTGGELGDIIVLKGGKVWMEPGAAPLTVTQVAATHEAYVMHTTTNVVKYSDGVPVDAEKFFKSVRDK